jgi:hypothetical protein
MKKTLLKLLFIPTIFILSCEGQTNDSEEILQVNDFEFQGWFGSKKNAQTGHMYSLLGTGFFRAPSANNTDSIISTWIKTHPEAIVIPVYTFGPTETDNLNSKMTYCWLVDESDTLNIVLVKEGAVPGGTMQRPKTWKEMSRKEKKLYDEHTYEEVHVSDKEYQFFIEKLKVAEEYARKNKLGIWAEEVENE